MGLVYSHLSEEERQVIQALMGQDCSLRRIAARLNRPVSTVSREIKRNTWFPSNQNESYRPYRPKRLKTGPWTERYYVAGPAHKKALRRARIPRKPMKLAHDPLVEIVADGLRRGWSPMMIAGRLRRRSTDPMLACCAETIYSWIYSPQARRLNLIQYLPRAHKKRRRTGGRRARGPKIPLRVSLHERSALVDSRTCFGHWEADTIIGAGPAGTCLHTEVERKTRFLMVGLLPSKSAHVTLHAQYRLFSPLPEEARKSITMDNGTEFSLHHQLLESLGILTYFADPYSSWQRGSNENRNGIIRRYPPKRTNLDNLNPEELADITDEINNRPMRILGYKTPAEAYAQETAKLNTTNHVLHF